MKKTLIGLMMSVLILSGCGTGPSTTNPEITTGSTANQPVEKRVVKIGVIAPLSGPGADYGEDVMYPIKTTVEKYNSDTSKKYQIDLIVEDGKCDGATATSAIQKLINIDKVEIVIGGVCSNETMAITTITQPKKIFTLSSTEVSSQASNIGDYFYRFWKIQDISNVLSNYMKNKGLGKIAIISEKSEYPVDFVENFVRNYNYTQIFSFESSEKDFNLLVKQIKKEAFSGILISSSNTDSLFSIINSLKKEGLLKYYQGNIYGDAMIASEKIIQAFSGDLEGTFLWNVKSVIEMNGKGNEYLKTMNYKYKVAELQVVFPKEAIDLMLDGIDAGNVESEQMRSYFESINNNSQRDGMFGKYYFDQSGDAVGIQYVIQQIQSGQVVPVE